MFLLFLKPTSISWATLWDHNNLTEATSLQLVNPCTFPDRLMVLLGFMLVITRKNTHQSITENSPVLHTLTPGGYLQYSVNPTYMSLDRLRKTPGEIKHDLAGAGRTGFIISQWV